MKFIDKLSNLKPYEPVKENYEIRLNANESYFGANKHLAGKLRGIFDRIELNRYPDPDCGKLREAFGKCYRVKPSEVVCGNGSDELINLICQTFCERGDRVVVNRNDFSMYAFYAKLMECEVREVENNENLTVDVEGFIEAAKESGARLAFFSNPCNPTSLQLDKKTVARIVESLPDTVVVLDEAYMEFSEGSLISETKKYDNFIVLKTLSKAFGLAAIRLGFAVSNKKIIEILYSTKSPYNVNAITQEIGTLALSNRSGMEYCAEEIADAKQELYEGLKVFEADAKGDFEVIDGETNFVFVKTSKTRQIDSYLKKRGISIRVFDGYLRITAGSETENEKLVAAISEVSGILWI